MSPSHSHIFTEVFSFTIEFIKLIYSLILFIILVVSFDPQYCSIALHIGYFSIPSEPTTLFSNLIFIFTTSFFPNHMLNKDYKFSQTILLSFAQLVIWVYHQVLSVQMLITLVLYAENSCKLKGNNCCLLFFRQNVSEAYSKFTSSSAPSSDLFCIFH